MASFHDSLFMSRLQGQPNKIVYKYNGDHHFYPRKLFEEDGNDNEPEVFKYIRNTYSSCMDEVFA